MSIYDEELNEFLEMKGERFIVLTSEAHDFLLDSVRDFLLLIGNETTKCDYWNNSESSALTTEQLMAAIADFNDRISIYFYLGDSVTEHAYLFTEISALVIRELSSLPEIGYLVAPNSGKLIRFDFDGDISIRSTRER